MKDEGDNLFPVNKYLGPDFFCDRQEETEKLIQALKNGRNTLMLAPRRFGKTGLIHHTFYCIQQQQKEAITIFCDIYSARNLAQFNGLLLSAVTEALTKDRHKMLETITKFFQSLKPVVGFDPFTGMPQVSLTSENSAKAEKDLQEILKIVDAQNKRVYIAIDEFQQIELFPENADAILRTYIQQCKNITFIFSGSQKHLLLPIFSNANRPFYASTDFLNLEKIDREKYAQFIMVQFAKKSKMISEENVKYVLDWNRTHTYYVQSICNKIDSRSDKKIEIELITEVMSETVLEQDAIMSSVKAMLPTNQWDLYEAICLEDQISSYTAKDFVHKYRLSSSASIVQAMKALEDKEMIYQSGIDSVTQKPIFESYNVFFGKWVKHRKSLRA